MGVIVEATYVYNLVNFCNNLILFYLYRHMCMVMRGIQKVNSKTVTSKMVGCFANQNVKDEFYKLIQITP